MGVAVNHVVVNGVTTTFNANPERVNNQTFQGRVYFWLDGFLNKQLGIFRTNKLGRDTLEFVEKSVVFAAIATKEVMKARFASLVRILTIGVDGTLLAHAFTSIKLNFVNEPIALNDANDFAKTIKKVADVATGFMFAAVTFAGMGGLLTYAKLLTFAGDAAELYVETPEFARLNQATANPQVALNPHNNNAPVVLTPQQQTALQTARTAQMLKTIKVVCAVVGGLLFVGQLMLPILAQYKLAAEAAALVSSYVPTAVAAVFTAELLAWVNATLSFVGSVCACAAEYQKSTQPLKVSV